jgi:hypothetical protein
MATKDWAAPLVAAMVTFGGLLALPEPSHDRGSPGTPDEEAAHDDEVLWAFPDAKAPEPGRVLLLGRITSLVAGHDCPVIRPRIEPPRWPGIIGGGSGNISMAIVCWTPALAVLDVTFNVTSFRDRDFVVVGDQTVATVGTGPFLGQAGYNATRVTVHVFNADGELVASNGNASEQARLKGRYTPEQLPGGVWYLGANATAPEGTQPLPAAARALLPQLRALLQGLPVGGVATTQTDALRALFGTLYVTAQVDELVHAP